MNTPARLLVLLIATQALIGCGFAEMAYNRAPAFVAGEFEDAFDLDDAQLGKLDQRLEGYFAWHREHELDRYREVLERAAEASIDGIQAEEVLQLNRDVHAAWRRAVSRAIDNIGGLAVSLTPAQLARYQEYHRDKFREHHEYLDKSELQREFQRVERQLERLEKWFGEFEMPLRDRVRARLRELPDIYEPWVHHREARHQALLAVLREAPERGIDSARLKQVLLDPDTDYARRYEPLRLAYWQAYAGALEDISTWAGKRQRMRVSSKLQDYARLVEKLKQG